MIDLKNKKNLLIMTLGVLVLVVIILIIFAFKNSFPGINKSANTPQGFRGQIINDEVKIPITTTISPNAGEVVERGEYNIKLQPQSEQDKVIILKAKISLKGAYVLAKPNADIWAKDNKLVFIKSNGALGLDGAASSWQLVFDSLSKKRNYEIIIEADKIISEKEINSNAKGFDLPNNWYDDSEAIATFMHLPQFTQDTMSSISFYYNQTAKSWAYGLATDNGNKTTSMWVK
jgi:hypothetical protein